MKFALKPISGLADVGVPHRGRDGPRTPPTCMKGVWKKFQITNLDMPNNVSSMKNAKSQSLALLMLGFPIGMGMAQELHPDAWKGSGKDFK